MLTQLLFAQFLQRRPDAKSVAGKGTEPMLAAIIVRLRPTLRAVSQLGAAPNTHFGTPQIRIVLVQSVTAQRTNSLSG
jgi:hypothetical protein